jgi:hypothetical protein
MPYLGGPDCLSSHVMIKALAEAVKKFFGERSRLKSTIAGSQPFFNILM